MLKMLNEYTKTILAVIWGTAAIVLLFLALYLEPTGEIHSSVVHVITILLSFASAMVGVEVINKIANLFSKWKSK